MARRHVVLLLLLALALTGAVVLALAWEPGGPEAAPGGGRDPLEAPPQDAHPRKGEAAPASPSDLGRSRVGGARDSAAAGLVDATQRLTGHVVTAIEHDPIEGARVTLLRQPPLDGDQLFDEKSWWCVLHTAVPASVVAETVTDATGAFSFDDVGADRIVVHAEAPGRALGVGIPDDEFEMTIELGAPVERRIRVLDESDAAVTTATAYLLHETYEAPPAAIVRPDDDGWLVLETSHGNEMVVRAEGFATMWLQELSELDGTTVVLRPEATISGVVIDGDGKPVADAVVLASDAPDVPVRSDAAGRFTVRGLFSASERVDLRAHAAGRTPVEIGARPGATDVRIEMRAVAGASGTIVFADGRVAANARVEAWQPDGSYLGNTDTDDAGRFAFPVLPPGAVRFSCTVHPPGSPEIAHPISLGDHVDETTHLDEGVHLGDLRLQLDRVPVSYVFVKFEGPDGTAVAHVFAPYDASVDITPRHMHGRGENTYWRAVPLPPGEDVELKFECASDLRYARHFTQRFVTRPLPDGTPDRVVVPSSKGATRLDLVIVRRDGRPIPHDAAPYWVVNQPGGRTGRLVVNERRDGDPPSARIEVEAERPFRVTAWAKGCGTLEMPFDGLPAGEQRIECSLAPESVVTGRLVTRTGRPVLRAEVFVRVVTEEGGISESEVPSNEFLPGGAFAADQLAAGRGRVTIWDDSFSIIAEETFEVGEGQRMDLGEIVVGALPEARGVVLMDGVPQSGVGVTVVDGKQIIAETSTVAGGRFAFRVPRRPGAQLVVGDLVRYDLADALAKSPVRLQYGAIGEAIVSMHGPGYVIVDLTFRGPGGVALAPHAFGAHGTWEYFGLPVGEIDVVAKTDDGRTLESRVTITANNPVIVSFDND